MERDGTGRDGGDGPGLAASGRRAGRAEPGTGPAGVRAKQPRIGVSRRGFLSCAPRERAMRGRRTTAERAVWAGPGVIPGGTFPSCRNHDRHLCSNEGVHGGTAREVEFTPCPVYRSLSMLTDPENARC